MLNILLDDGSARDFLSRSLPLFANGRYRLESACVHHSTLRADWSVQYCAEVCDEHSGRIEPLLLVAQRFPGGGARSYAAEKIRRRARGNVPRRPLLRKLIAEPAGTELLIYPFPLDARMKFLAAAAAPRAALQFFQSQAPSLVCGCTTGLRIDVLRYVPGKRCQIRYVFRRAGHAPYELLGKVFYGDRGVGLYENMRGIAQAFATGGISGFRAPNPLAWLPEWRMLVQEKVPGSTLYHFEQTGSLEDAHLTAAARTIAILHSSGLRPQRAHTLDDEIAVVERSYQALTQAVPECADYGPVLQRLRAARVELRPSPPVPVHRDFYDKQVLVGPATVLIDFDTLATGCAEMDLANFVAHLHLREIQRGGDATVATRRAALFLDGYNRQAPRAAETRLLNFYLASTSLRLACLYRFREPAGSAARRLLALAVHAL